MEKLYDVIVIGGGPAGLTAALYLARAKYRVLVLEKDQLGGQIATTHEVVNYPGVAKIGGKALTETMRAQAESFGAEFLMAEAERLSLDGDIKTVHTTSGNLKCFGVLLATGAQPRAVGFQGEEQFKGRGVAYCATCDGEFFVGKEVFVVGGGYAAAEESVFLTKYARHVTILIRKDDFSCAASLADQARNHEKITVLTNTVLEEAAGEEGITYLRYKNTATGEVTEYRAKDGETLGVFVFVGYTPDTALVKGIADLDERGYIITDKNQRTSVPGLYAAGDVCIKPLRQVVTATADGALAAAELEKYCSKMQEKTGLRPEPPETKKSPTKPKEAAPQTSTLFSPELQQQLHTVLDRMEQPLVLKLFLDSRPVSTELERYMKELAAFSSKLTVEVSDSNASPEAAPCVRVCRADGRETGLAFHGVPGGHEFTSFILGLYNAAGPGQTLDRDVAETIKAIDRPINIMVLVTLSCSMCPELVVAAQRIAAMNPLVTAEVYDVMHFEKLRSKYKVMSVPCLVINEDRVSFGRKNIRQVLDMLKEL